jgi:phospholipid/cholesterol/gamma-HCH transport system ATP-binding protein
MSLATDIDAIDPVVRLVDVHKAFGADPVLQGITMSVARGSTAVVMGASGSGKSVLIKHVVQLLRPDRGEIWAWDERVDELRGDALDALRLRIGYLFQGGALFDSMTVFENIEFILERHSRLGRRERADRVFELLAWVHLEEKADQAPSELSGGQKKRVALARALALEPHLMLFDEPTTGLDPVSVRSVSELIVRLREERGMSSVVITHDLLCAELVADRVHFLHDGAFLAEGTVDEVRAADHPEIRNFFGGSR